MTFFGKNRTFVTFVKVLNLNFVQKMPKRSKHLPGCLPHLSKSRLKRMRVAQSKMASKRKGVWIWLPTWHSSSRNVPSCRLFCHLWNRQGPKEWYKRFNYPWLGIFKQKMLNKHCTPLESSRLSHRRPFSLSLLFRRSQRKSDSALPK